MQKHIHLQQLLSFFILFFAISNSAFAARTLVVKRKSAKVFAEPNKKSTFIAELKKNDELTENGRKGMYWKVATREGKKGYVSVLAVKTKPNNDNAGLSAALRSAVQQGRSSEDAANVRSRSAVMGVRGLASSDDVQFAGNLKPNPRLVFMMESMVVTSEELATIEEGVYSEIEAKMK
ncbi:MAG: SH3 domain-containing protein [Zetaproteobacteria bacterium]|nr:SH3 domain-containing protein [Zetaproteobacteria bacterium]